MSEARLKYEADGCFLGRALVPAASIDRFMQVFATSVLPNPQLQLPLVRTLDYGPLRQKNGFMQDPILDIHSLASLDPALGPLADAALEIITAEGIRSQIQALHGCAGQTLVMSTFVDRSSGTAPHQDCYYIDSDPPRHLTAAWIALEDIATEAGRFYVLPKSHKTFFTLDEAQQQSNLPYETMIADYLSSRSEQVWAPEMRKGDVLFWNSGTIHGAFKPSDDAHSRKSFTVHFIPDGVQFVRNHNAEKLRYVDNFMHNGVRCRVDRLTAPAPTPAAP
jgi:phytanoyl-CoA hydroxylase